MLRRRIEVAARVDALGRAIAVIEACVGWRMAVIDRPAPLPVLARRAEAAHSAVRIHPTGARTRAVIGILIARLRATLTGRALRTAVVVDALVVRAGEAGDRSGARAAAILALSAVGVLSALEDVAACTRRRARDVRWRWVDRCALRYARQASRAIVEWERRASIVAERVRAIAASAPNLHRGALDLPFAVTAAFRGVGTAQRAKARADLTSIRAGRALRGLDVGAVYLLTSARRAARAVAAGRPPGAAARRLRFATATDQERESEHGQRATMFHDSRNASKIQAA